MASLQFAYVWRNLVKDLREGFFQLHRRHVEARAVEEQSVNVDPVFGRHVEYGVPQRDEIVDQQIDRNGILPRVVLTGAREKGLREEETGNPERCRRVLVVPRLKETQPRIEALRGNGKQSSTGHLEISKSERLLGRISEGEIKRERERERRGRVRCCGRRFKTLRMVRNRAFGTKKFT